MADTRKKLTAEDIAGIKKAAEQGLVGGLIKGKRIVFTGTMSMRRVDMQALSRACGAYVEDDVRSWRRGVLVVGDTGIHGRTSKIAKAENQGWEVISEAEFVKRATARQ
jgi:NAD-dependent DNA ligase